MLKERPGDNAIATFLRDLTLLRDAADREFAQQVGWILSSPFSVATLRRNGTDRRWLNSPSWTSVADHPTFFRDRVGRASGVLAHVYDDTMPLSRFPGRKSIEPETTAWAESYGLRVSFLDELTSWWFPGWTRVVLFEPGDAR